MNVSWLVCDLNRFNNMSRFWHFEWLIGRSKRYYLNGYRIQSFCEMFNCERCPSIWVCQFVNQSTRIDLYQNAKWTWFNWLDKLSNPICTWSFSLFTWRQIDLPDRKLTIIQTENGLEIDKLIAFLSDSGNRCVGCRFEMNDRKWERKRERKQRKHILS